jgi:hypothetical protein
MDAVSDVGAELRARGWRQGSVVSAAACESLGFERPDPASLAVVTSQDCDIVANLELESTIELIAASVSTTSNGGTLFGKNPRRLSLPLTNSSGFLTLDIRQRAFVSKAILCQFTPNPDARLCDRDVRTMARWLGKRYTRDAFPDAFNDRLEVVRKKLDKISKKEISKPVTSILVLMKTGNVELPDNESYLISLWFVFRDDHVNSDLLRSQAERFAQDFTDIINSCDGIIVDEDPEVRSLRDVTLEDIEVMKRLDLDYRSIAPRPGGELP